MVPPSPPSTPEFIQTERISPHIGLVAFNRPDVRNAVNAGLASEFNSYLEWFESDPELRVGIVTGNGPIFCAGGDVKENAPNVVLKGGFAGFTQTRRTKPWIACLQGPAVGGGAELALACEFVVMAEDATMVWPGIRHGLPWRGMGPIYALRKLPPALFNELLLTGEPLTAQRALQHAIVNRVVPAASVRQEAILLAQQVARSPQAAVRKCLDYARAHDGVTLEQAWRMNSTTVISQEESTR